jgi:hypothetical protein
MAHFAELDSNNITLRVVVVADAECLGPDGIESEAVGVSFCQRLFGEDTAWKQTSYNANFRKKYAGIGFTYDQARDAFIPPQPYPSWLLDEDTCNWGPPVPYPEDGLLYRWDEGAASWVLSEDA